MADNVRVAVRVRPFNQRERDHDAKCIIRMDPHTQSTVIVNPEDGAHASHALAWYWYKQQYSEKRQ